MIGINAADFINRAWNLVKPVWQFLWEHRPGYEVQIAIVSAVIGSVLTMIFEYWMSRREAARQLEKDKQEAAKQLEKDRQDAAAALAVQIANHLDGMVKAFKDRQVPHVDGRAFNGLIERFKSLQFAWPTGLTEAFSTLDRLSDNAGKLDESLYELKDLSDLKPEKENDFREWILVAQRQQGDLYVKAQDILLKSISPVD
jgi:hypothetical protein